VDAELKLGYNVNITIVEIVCHLLEEFYAVKDEN